MSVLDDLAAALDPPTLVGSVPGSGYTPRGECKILEQSSPRPRGRRFFATCAFSAKKMLCPFSNEAGLIPC